MLAFAAAIGLAPAVAHAQSPTKPNILVIWGDDIGQFNISAYNMGMMGYRTPNIDRVAREGALFTDWYGQQSCTAGRAAFITGQSPIRTGLTKVGLPGAPEGMKKEDPTVATMLRAQGYTTGQFGKNHLGDRDDMLPSAHGFDEFFGNLYHLNAEEEPENADYPKDEAFKKRFGPRGVIHSFADGRITDTGPLTKKRMETIDEEVLAKSVDFMERAVKAQKPFFLYFPQYAVHAPFNSDPRFAANYANSGKPANAQAFATLIEGMDKSLGDMMDHFEKLGVAEDTLIIFLGDNGSDAPLGHEHAVACAEPLRGKKGSHYEGGVRVPFIAAWVKAAAENAHQKRLPIAAGAVQTQLAAVYDIYPTLLGLTGAANPAAHVLDGRPLDALLTGKRDAKHEEAFLMHYPHAPHRSDYFTTYREGAWKVIYHYFPTEVPSSESRLQPEARKKQNASPPKGGTPNTESEGGHYQLYNLQDDPFEQKNLAATHPAELKRLMSGMIAKLEAQGAVYPVEKGTSTPVKPKLP